MAPACHRPPYRYYQITSFYLLEVKASHIGQCFNPIQHGGGYIYPPCRIFRFSIGKRYQRGVKVVCKLKFGKLLDNKKDFRSKKFFGAEPWTLKVEWVANFGTQNLDFFYFDLKFWAQKMAYSLSFLTQHLE